MKKFIAIISFFILGGCSTSVSEPIVLDNTENIQSELFFQEFGILDDKNENLEIYIREYFQKNSIGFSITSMQDAIENKNKENLVYIEKDEIVPKFDKELIKYHSKNLSDKSINILNNVQNSYRIGFVGIPNDMDNKQLKIYQALFNLFKDKDIIIKDNKTREFFGIDTFQEKRVVKGFENNVIDITKHIVYHFYQEDDYCRLVSLGMDKFGLPDIAISGVPCTISDSLTSFVNLITQTLIENHFISKEGFLSLDIDKLKNNSLKNILNESLLDNAKGKTKIKLIFGELDEGDNYNTQLHMILSDPNNSSFQEELYSVIGEVFGSEDSVKMVKHNKEILRLSGEAKKELPRLYKIFNDGIDSLEKIQVKLPFKTDDGGNEWMWIEITNWEENNIRGVLVNQPYYIKDLSIGSIVNRKQEEVFDYLYIKSNGEVEGNKTAEVLYK